MRTTNRLGIGAVAAAVLLLPLAAGAAEPSDDPMAGAGEASPVLEGSWRAMAPSPFGSAGAAGAWLGDELSVVDIATARAAAYDPAADAWTELEPRGTAGYDWTSPWTWTGSELVITDRGSGRLQAFDPAAQTWRSLPAAPMGRADGVIWADGSLVVVAYGANTEILETARLDLAGDTWQRLPDEPGNRWHLGLLSTGEEIVTSTMNSAGGGAVVLRLTPNADAWDRSEPAPAGRAQVPPAWTGHELVFADGSRIGPEYGGATYDLATDIWTPRDFDCPVSSSGSLWFDDRLFQPQDYRAANDPSVRPGFALDPVSGDCYALADDPVLIDYLAMGKDVWPARTPAVTIEVNGEVMLWSGARIGLDGQPDGDPPNADREGIIFTPSPTG